MPRTRSLPDPDMVSACAAALPRMLLLGERDRTSWSAWTAMLEREIAVAFRSRREPRPEAKAAAACRALQRALAGIRRSIRSDLKAAYDRDPAAESIESIALCYPGPRALAVHRIAHALQRAKVPLVPRMMSEWAHAATGIDIHPGATIGDGFFIDHGTGVVIGETTVIGRNCTLYQGVTLGARRFDRHADGSLRRGAKRHPTLKDGVTVYSNSTILGGATVIGRGATIGAGVWVQDSVPAGATVRPSPTR